MNTDTNLFADLPEHVANELTAVLLTTSNIRIERIVSTGHCSPDGFWYDQPQAEWVLVLKGHAKLRFEEGDVNVDLKPGDFVNIPAHCRHRVEWTTTSEPTVWIAIHYDS